MKYSVKKLPNNLTILTVPSNECESVMVDLFVKTGSRSEEEKEHGMSHFLEHFFFKGSSKYPTAKAISEIVDGLGGEMNANTGKEHTQYYIKTDSKHLSVIFDIITDMIQNPLFDESELEKEKGVIVEELNMYKDAPMYEIENILDEEMFVESPLARRIVGSKESVTAFDRQMFLDYMSRFYSASNMILAISGKFDQKELNNLIKKGWAHLKDKKARKFLPHKDKQDAPRFAIQYKETEQTHFTLGFKGLNYNDKNNEALSVLSAILGGGMSSRLFSEIREKRGLAYYVKCNSYNYADTGAFVISAGVKNESAKDAFEAILEEIKKLADTITKEEVEKAKNYLIGRTTLALEDNGTKLEWYLDQIAFHKDILSPKQYFASISKVQLKDVLAMCKKILNTNKMTFALIGPYKDKNIFENLIK